MSGGNITDDKGSAITQRGICWSTNSQSPTTANSHVFAATGGIGLFNVQITGLSLNTTYYARAFAINGNGTAYGNTITFTTPTVANTSPTAVADNYSVVKSGTFSGNVLLNDFDDDGNTITATIVAKPSYHTGTFTLNANGTFTYTNNGTNAPSDFFSYYLSDGISNSSTVGVGITIVVPQNAPLGANGTINMGTATSHSSLPPILHSVTLMAIPSMGSSWSANLAKVF